MAVRTEVTVQRAVDRIRELIAAGDNEGALDYGDQVVPVLEGQLTAHDYWIISQLLSSADRAAYDVDPEGDRTPDHRAPSSTVA
jgi:hypothetical protein